MTNKSFLHLVFALTTIAGCGSEKHKEEEHAVLAVTRPARRDTEIVSDAVCQLRSIQHIEVRALERGYLETVFVDEGQSVKQGQRLFQILPSLYQAEVQKAQAEAQFAQLEYQNTKVLSDGKVVSPNELALGKAKLDKANAELALAKVHRDFTEIKAPFDGIVGRFHVRVGSLVSEGELLTTLSDNRKIWGYFNVTEAEYLDSMAEAAKGKAMVVKLRMANGKVFDQPGTVETIEADFNNETGTIAFRATFPNPVALLRHGETGNVLITKPLHGALIIPQKATFEVLDKKFIFVVDKEGVLKARQISIGEELPQVYVVDHGLAENETFLLEGISRVKDGEKIASKFLEPDEVLSHLDVPAE